MPFDSLTLCLCVTLSAHGQLLFQLGHPGVGDLDLLVPVQGGRNVPLLALGQVAPEVVSLSLCLRLLLREAVPLALEHLDLLVERVDLLLQLGLFAVEGVAAAPLLRQAGVQLLYIALPVL